MVYIIWDCPRNGATQNPPVKDGQTKLVPSPMPRYAYRALVVLRNGKQVGLTGICAPYQKKCFRHCTGIMMAKLESIGSPIPKHMVQVGKGTDL